MKAIADTGFLVAFLNRGDRHHAWAVELARRSSGPFLTCEAVLAEAAFHLGSSQVVLAAIESGLLLPSFDLNSNLHEMARLAARYADRQPDLADLCLIRMSELHPKLFVITVDEADFRVYRRNQRETIPLICPPRL
jgi:predicted nucleic acid-binding protein